MIYIQTENSRVTFTHFMPFHEKYGLHKTEAELLKDGYLVEAVPEKPDEEPPEGKEPRLCYDGSAFYWEYEEVVKPPLTYAEEIAALKTRVAELEATNAALLGGE